MCACCPNHPHHRPRHPAATTIGDVEVSHKVLVGLGLFVLWFWASSGWETFALLRVTALFGLAAAAHWHSYAIASLPPVR